MADGTPPPSVRFHYIKSNLFRVVHADGAYGGLSPTGDIFFSLFSQRPPIPTSTVQPVKEDGELGDELVQQRTTRDGIVREMEVGIALRPEVAEGIIKFLQEKVEQYKNLKKEQDKVSKE